MIGGSWAKKLAMITLYLMMRIVLHWLDPTLPPALVALDMFAKVLVPVQLLKPKPSATEVLVEERQGRGEELIVSSQTSVGRPFDLKTHVLYAWWAAGVKAYVN